MQLLTKQLNSYLEDNFKGKSLQQKLLSFQAEAERLGVVPTPSVTVLKKIANGHIPTIRIHNAVWDTMFPKTIVKIPYVKVALSSAALTALCMFTLYVLFS